METDNCRACGAVLDVEHLVVTECDDILCSACMGHHECSICGTEPSEHDSDSEYVTEEASTTRSSETDDQSSDEQ